MAPIRFRLRLCAGMAAIQLAIVPALAADDATAMAPASASKGLTDAQQARLVLDRLGFGARPGEVERVRATGVKAWIARQLDPESIPDDGLDAKLRTLAVPAMSTAELFAKYPNPAAVRRQLARKGDDGMRPAADDEDAQAQVRQALRKTYKQQGYGRPRDVYLQLAADRLLRATYSERQLQEVMVDFWSNHFNVYARKNTEQWLLPAFDRDVIRPNALGKFRDLLLATARSPAMLLYLDNFESVAPDAGQSAAAPAQGNVRRAQRRPKGINENYARELMELHTLGVDGGYSQQDVREVARCFTGWTIADPRGYAAFAAADGDEQAMQRLERQRRQLGLPTTATSGTFYFNRALHDNGPKTVLGQRITGGGIEDGLAVIDLLARQPATARFIAGKLAVKFVGDDPSPALVARVAAVFQRSDGDIRATLQALFSDPEFFTARTYRAKIKTPFELVVSSLRALQADTDGRAIQLLLADLGEPLYGYQAPTGYPDRAAEWVNAGALLKRMNFAIALVGNRIPGTRVDLQALGGSDDPPVLLSRALARLLDDDVDPATRATLARQMQRPLPDATMVGDDSDEDLQGDDGRTVVRDGREQKPRLLAVASGDPTRIQVAALILGSPDFQRQ